jgi:hypothetical protein
MTTGSGAQASSAPEPVTVGDLRAELALYPDDAHIDVLVPDAVGLRVLRVVAMGYGSVAPDEPLNAVFSLVTEQAPPLT